MIGKLFYGVCGVALVTGTAVLAQPSTGDANKQICRTSTDTGSRLGRSRSCHTAQEWAELRRQTVQNVDRIQTRQAMNADPAGQ